MAGAYDTALWSFWLVMGSRVLLLVADVAHGRLEPGAWALCAAVLRGER